ncbi:MAG: helix-hairpin-helix domain-containing protein [Paludibacteraceae bacterium]|nr:helix-hairpin-helix domain-containing protein [Paludibacteraceae bacterium]
MLAKEQYVGAIILFAVALAAWLFVALYPQKTIEPLENDAMSADSIYMRYDQHRSDSIRAAREARWQAKKDSFRRADDLRFARWARERQMRYDSARLADSLWRDSVGWRFARKIKKDTIIDLNHCDTTELQYICGIGGTKARSILRYGRELGGYYSAKQLADEQLKDLHLDTLQKYFIADTTSITRLSVNTSNTDQLRKHPYLRYSQAKAIYEYRRRHIRIESIDQLRKLPELSAEDILRLAPYLSFE